MCVHAKQIMGWIQEWILNQQISHTENKLIAALWQKGGAEGWLQVELAKKFETLPNTAWVQREQNIYNDDRKRVDFQIKCNNGPLAEVELKVESLFQSSDVGRVTMDHKNYQGVQEDILKLAHERKPEHQADSAYAVAIVWSHEAIQGMDNWLRQKGSGNPTLADQLDIVHGERMMVKVYVIAVTGD